MSDDRTYTWDEAANEGFIEYIFDGSFGVYVPQRFCQLRAESWESVEPEDLAACLAGPKNRGQFS